MYIETRCFFRRTAGRICHSASRICRVTPLIPLTSERRCYGIPRSFPARTFSTAPTHPKYEWIDGAECLEKYIPSGYHPIQIGDNIRDRYEVVDKLVYGGWSTVWLVRDFREKQYLALKVGIADCLPFEVSVLQAISAQENLPGSEMVPRLLDEFTIKGPNGSHPCHTTTVGLCNLRESSFSRLFHLDTARALAYKLTLAVAYLHSRGFAHGDIHLRNVLLLPQTNFDQLTVAQFREEYGEPESYPVRRRDGQPLTSHVPSTAVVPLNMGKKAQEITINDAHILLSDFGESYAPAQQVRFGRDCHTPVDFCPPEALFEPDAGLSFSADVWSLATAICDILGMQPLFCSGFYSDAEVMCQIVDILGPLPADWCKKWEDRGDFFDDAGIPTNGRHVWPRIEGAFRERVQQFRKNRNMEVFCKDEEAAILDMMSQMLRYRPEERPSVQQILQSEWMANWAHADYERSSDAA